MVFQKIHVAIYKEAGCLRLYNHSLIPDSHLQELGPVLILHSNQIINKNILQYMYFTVSPEKFTLSESSRKTFTNMKRTTTLFNSYIMHLLMYRGFR